MSPGWTGRAICQAALLPRSCANDHFPRVSAIVGRTQETFVDNSGRRRSLFGYAFGDLDVGAFWDQILRKKTGRKPGRPKGQPGATMSLIDHPDHVIRHEPGCRDTAPALAERR